LVKLVLIENGRLGNNLFQLSLMHYIRQHMPEIEILVPEIPMLRIEKSQGYNEAIKQSPDLEITAHDINEDDLRSIVSSNKNAVIHCSAWGMNEKYYYNSRGYIKSLIKNLEENKNKKTNHELVFHIRGGDIWQNRFFERKKIIHPDYSAVPISFYKKVHELSGKPVKFVAENSVPKWYIQKLKSTIRGTSTTFTKNTLADFIEISRGSEIGLGVSTFSWMAAFAGEPTVVHMPILGIFDVKRRPDLSLYNPSWNIQKYKFEQYEWTGTIRDTDWLLTSECHQF
jgi:hypothetical protein